MHLTGFPLISSVNSLSSNYDVLAKQLIHATTLHAVIFIDTKLTLCKLGEDGAVV